MNTENRKTNEPHKFRLTPNQMLSRLPISLAQLKVRSNSEKLKR